MLIQNFYPVFGGAENQALELARMMIRREMDVLVVTRRTGSLPSTDMVSGVPVRRLLAFGPGLISSLVFMLSSLLYLLFRASTYEVIHVHLASSQAVAAAFIGKLLKKKVVIKIGGGNAIGEIVLSKKSFFGRIKLWVLGVLQPRFVVVSRDQINVLRGFGLDKLEVEIIPNGVNPKTYHPVEEGERKRIREMVGWSGFVLLFGGRFSPDKLRVDVFENLMKAWSRVIKRRKGLSLYFVGGGPLKEDYSGLIRQYGVGASVHLWDSRDDLIALYQAADVFLLPSIAEGLSNAMLEALSTGVPLLASRVPGIQEVMTEGLEGFMFDPLDPDDIERSLEALLADPDRLAEMKQAAFDRAKDYSIDKTVDRYLKLYAGMRV